MARKKQHNNNLPTFDELIVPTIGALKKLGGSGTIEEINETVYEIASISEDILKILHNDNGLISEVDYRLAWSRTYLKKFGLIDNSSRGVWALNSSDIDISKVDTNLIVKTVRDSHKKSDQKEQFDKKDEKEILEEETETANWKDQLLDTLFKIQPDAFERLAQRLLRESGFIQVEVTGKTGDGGIDGKGIVRISGFLSFHVIFQCKRCLLYTSPSPRDRTRSRMPSSA